MFTNRTGCIIIALLVAAIAGVVAGFVYVWLKTPLAPPIVYNALPTDYTGYWGIVGAGFALAALVVIVELGAIWWELRRMNNAKNPA